MGSLYREENGTWIFAFFDKQDRRAKIRFPRTLNRKKAQDFAERIGQLVDSSRLGLALSSELTLWLQSADPKLVARLNRLGLCSKRNDPTVAEFVSQYLQRRTDLSDASLTVMRHTERNLKDFFGTSKLLREVTLLDAREFRLWLLQQEQVSLNTANRRCGFARQFFHDALELGIISANPFLQKFITTTVGPAKKVFVPAETIEQVISRCEESEWRMVFAFSRWLGCRIPSEIRQLKWKDIDLQQGTILLCSPKTRRHNKGERLVPIFSPLRPHLVQSDEAGNEPEAFVFPTLRRHTNLSTVAKRLVKKAGIEPWGDFFNALRASRETELMDQYGLRKACQWIGNTPGIAVRNYSLVRQTAYEDLGGRGEEKNGANSGALRDNPEQFGALQTSENPVFSGLSEVVSGRYLTRISPENAENNGITEKNGAFSGVLEFLELLLPKLKSLSPSSLRQLLLIAESLAGMPPKPIKND